MSIAKNVIQKVLSKLGFQTTEQADQSKLIQTTESSDEELKPRLAELEKLHELSQKLRELTDAPERILVVGDVSIRESVCSMLTAAGYSCRQTGSGVEALSILAEDEGFALILSELVMPDIFASALLERTKEKYPDMPVVIVTALHDSSAALAVIRDGAYDYLQKPFEREQLLAIVRRALENRRLKLENRASQQSISDLERSYDITLEALGDALDLKGAENEGHSKRVTAFAIALARQMRLPQEQIRVIARGAFLHDIGKMAIPDSILRKPGALTQEEMAIMQEHCYRGYQMLRKIPFLMEAAEIVYAHHERWDGTGYPRGLKGNEIPLGARIISIADTLDMIMSDQYNRAAQPFAVASDEIKRSSGRQFDPEAVNTFLSIPEALWRDLRKEIDQQIYRFTAYSRKATP